MRNYTHCNIWDEVNYPFPNLNTVALGMDKLFQAILHCKCDQLSMLGLKLTPSVK